MNNPYDKQDFAAKNQNTPRRNRKRGCFRWLLFGGIGMAVLLMLCGVLTLGFLLFPPPSMDVLVVGIDSRGNEGAVARTDSIMVINMNADKVSTSILSIPRGLFVTVPNYGSQMINTANFLGEANQPGTGMSLLAQTIQQNFDIQIDRYVRMDFAGFEALIDAVGGVDIEVHYIIEDYNYPTADYGTIHVRFEPGWQHMNGERALIYARTRHSDDDYRRAERQQQVLSAFVSRAANPLTWVSLTAVLNQSVETNLSIGDMMSIAPTSILGISRADQLVINRDYILPGANGPVPDYAKIAPYVMENFD